MAEKITYSLSVQVSGGPKLSESKTIELEAYDKLSLAVPAGAEDVAVNLQPGGVGLARFLVFTASAYGGGLSYKINAADAAAIALDGPHFFAGAGAVGLLYNPPLGDASPAPPTTLFVSNAGGADVTLQILVARDATP